MPTNNFEAIYLNNPSFYSFFSLKESLPYSNTFDDFVIIENGIDFLSYNYIKSYRHVDFNKGYKKLYLCDNIYNKIKDKIQLHYNVKCYIKAYKYGNGNQIIENYSFCLPQGDFKLFTVLTSDMAILNSKDLLNKFDGYNVWYELCLKEITSIHTYNDLLLKMKEVEITKNKPKLLLHSCCGPCSSYCLDFLSKTFDITLLYFNPNIFPKDEYFKRLNTQKEIIKKLNLDIDIIEIDYEHELFLNKIKGFENCEEKGKRCYLCYQIRLEKTAVLSAGKFDYFTTTISVSPHKVSDYINEIGFNLEKKYNVNFLFSNFKLNDGYKKSIELSKRFNLYRQDYCGCEFSKS